MGTDRPLSLPLFALPLLLSVTGCDGDVTRSDQLSEIDVASPTEFLDVGQTLQLSVAARSATGASVEPRRVSWSSSNPAVAEVVDGRVAGLATGSVFIRAAVGAAADSVRLTVETPVAELVVTPGALALIQGRAARLRVEMRDASGSPVAHSLTLTSSAGAVATVSSEGEVRAVSLGSATLTVAAGQRSVRVPVEVVTGARYAVTRLGTLGGTSTAGYPGSTGRDLNNLGVVVGGALTVSGGWGAFLWRDGKMTDLGTLPGYSLNEAYALNDSGTVVGSAAMSSNVFAARAWTWRSGTFTPLPVADTSTRYGSYAVNVNNAGQVVGRTRSTYFKSIAGDGYLWQDGRLTWLERTGSVPGWGESTASSVAAINGRGVMAANMTYGCIGCSPPISRGYVWESGRLTAIPAPVAGAYEWLANDVNDRGQVVGSYRKETGGGYAAFLWDGAVVTDLAPMPFGSSINNYGDIVGGGYLRRGTQLTDLNTILVTSEWQVTAVAINDLGQILAQGYHRPTGATEAVLLTPAS